MVQTSYQADVLPIGHLWSLALQHRNTTAHRWFPLSPHHCVSIGISCCTSSIMQKGTLCLLICMLIPFPLKQSTSQYAGKCVFTQHGGGDHDSTFLHIQNFSSRQLLKNVKADVKQFSDWERPVNPTGLRFSVLINYTVFFVVVFVCLFFVCFL